ncbi:MAG: ComEC/Rec2 family competence protein [Bacteroidota bacterium]|nr:ComEC/Rec2 family competence protein [Bacteroidota bacterium]
MMASFWQQVPFIRFIIPLIAGIIFQLNIHTDLPVCLSLLILSAITAWIGFKKINNYSRLWWPGFMLNVLLFSFGMTIHYIQNKPFSQNEIALSKNSLYLLKINEPVICGKNSYKAQALVLGAFDSLKNFRTNPFNLLLYFKKDSNVLKLHYGDLLIIKSQIQEISLPQNPEEFNFKKYLGFKHIYYQTYIKPNCYININKNEGFWLFELAYKSQDFIKQTLQKYVSGKNEIGVGEALLFGFDDDIDPDVFISYSRTGTLHVLAVSGMHVGLIFIVLGWVLSPMDKLKQLRWLKPVLLLGGIWLYSLLCGLSPSILRATIMLCFLVIGGLIKRRSSAFNSLAASAFMLLIFDSSLIANVGFQLSYAAVLGIIAFYQPLYNLFDFTSRVGDSVWKVIAVSLAAQTLTFPMSLYYFHQFPNYFLLANLLIIPLTTLIIYAGILLLIISKFHLLAYWLGLLIQWLIYSSNFLAHQIELLPFSYIDNIYISSGMMILIYLFCLCTVLFFIKRDIPFLKLGLITLLVLFILRTYQAYQNCTQNNFLVYHIKNHLAIQIIRGNEALLITDSALLINPNARAYPMQGFMCKSGITHQKEVLQPIQNYSIQLAEHKMLGVFIKKCTLKNMHFEWILVQGKLYLNLDEILKNNKVKHLILNANIPFKKKRALLKIAAIYKIPVHDISKNGAFKVSLQDE